MNVVGLSRTTRWRSSVPSDVRLKNDGAMVRNMTPRDFIDDRKTDIVPVVRRVSSRVTEADKRRMTRHPRASARSAKVATVLRPIARHF